MTKFIQIKQYIAYQKSTDKAARQTLLDNINNVSILVWSHPNLHEVYDFRNLFAANDKDYYSFSEGVNFKAA